MMREHASNRIMGYEELREQFIRQQKDIVQRGRLLSLIEGGTLSSQRTKACREEVAHLVEIINARDELFNHLEATRNPVWIKMTNELDVALDEYGKVDTNSLLSIGQMLRKFCRVMSALIVGTWALDSLRKR
jgi:hypothetical protein